MISSKSAIVISDTSPINYLVLTGFIEVLPALYRAIIIPQAVHDELMHKETPMPVREWMASRPDWITVLPVFSQTAFQRLHRGSKRLFHWPFK